MYIQYFLKPQNFITAPLNKVFFWQRREEINFLSIKKIFANYPISLHIHNAPDPLDVRLFSANERDKKLYKITESSWFENASDMQKVMQTCGIYIAPRLDEGIGLSFLHALSLGMVVIAQNAPTMSEYITHNVNGYLVDFENPQALDFSNIESVRQNARKLATEGYEKYLIAKEQIVGFIES